MMAIFAIKSLRRTAKLAFLILLLQPVAMVAALTPVWYLSL
jgi:hypothetical protein